MFPVQAADVDEDVDEDVVEEVLLVVLAAAGAPLQVPRRPVASKKESLMLKRAFRENRRLQRYKESNVLVQREDAI